MSQDENNPQRWVLSALRASLPATDIPAVAKRLGMTEESFRNTLAGEDVFTLLELIVIANAAEMSLSRLLGVTGHQHEYVNGLFSETLATVEAMKDERKSVGLSDRAKTGFDRVNAPSHYVAGRVHEPIDVIEDWGLNYHLGQVIKYVSRAERKNDPLEDLEKAAWYLAREISNRKAREVGYELDSFYNEEKCDTCDGTGIYSYSEKFEECRDCFGSGTMDYKFFHPSNGVKLTVVETDSATEESDH